MQSTRGEDVLIMKISYNRDENLKSAAEAAALRNDEASEKKAQKGG